MNATDAIDKLQPETWAATTAIERLHFLEAVRENMQRYAEELAASDAAMKNGLMGEELYSLPVSLIATIVPMANTISACIDLYESIVHGHMPEPLEITEVRDGLYDIRVFPRSSKDKLMNSDRRDFIRVKGEPTQVNPMDKPPGIIAVLGAGNYSSSLEMAKALFLENKAVVHKPHHLNEATDRVWEKIFEPLVEIGAISFCDSDPERLLTKDPRLTKIYFTGGTGTAKKIMAGTDTELVSECGGNNPCIVVPGDKPWTEKQLQHQAIQIATISKLNGGAVCGRVQTVVTSEHWPQREAFLEALETALRDGTPAAGTYYPGSDEVLAQFQQHYPNATMVQPEQGKYSNAGFMLIKGVDEDGFAVRNEAFCQIIDEVPLDVEAEPEAFLQRAVAFCNEKLLGTLGCCILVDDHTLEAHREAVEDAVTELDYGGIAVNTMPPFIFLSPYLTWGGNEEGKEFVSGHGNFGNLLCYENVEKSIIYANFMSPGHMLNTNKEVFDKLAANMARFSMAPTWMNMTKLMAGAVAGTFKGKDF